MKSPAKLLLASTVILLLSSCSSTPKTSYVEDYLRALDAETGVLLKDDHNGQMLADFFNTLKSENLSDRIEKLYAEQFYFNDTFKTFTQRSDLIPYLQKTANNLQSIKLNVTDISNSNQDYYVRWIMDMTFTASGDTIATRSIGITHLRFNAGGKIILHQDYWDAVDGFYKHLPYVGYFIGIVQGRL